jgi:hypothetical protein
MDQEKGVKKKKLPIEVKAEIQEPSAKENIIPQDIPLDANRKPGPSTKTFNLPKKDKVAIVGCADSKMAAPFSQPNEWEFWGVNNLHLTMPKAPWSRWFEIHNINFSNNTYFRRGKTDFRGQPVQQYLEGINALGIPVYMQRPWTIVPNSVQFPFKPIIDKYGTYFTNTISWMMALAMIEGFKTIGVYGVDMAVSSPLRHQNEYSHQRPSCEYFIGMARGMGIEVILPDNCDLLKTRYMYGLQEPQEHAFNKKLNDMLQSMEQRQTEADKKHKIAEQQIQQYIGARSAIQEIAKIWGND